MEVPQPPPRLDRPNFDLLGRALVISLALHVLCYGGYKMEQRYHWLEQIPVPDWLQNVRKVLALVHPAPKPQPLVPQEPPLVFVEVNPSAAVTEPPKNAKYYSSRSSRAANPNADVDSNVPKINGEQAYVPKTESAPRNQPKPQAQPQPPAPEQTQPEAKLKAAQTPGDLAFAKLQPKLRDATGQDEEEHPRPRPRTLAEAQARQMPTLMPGEKMKQAGGVRPRAIQSTLDAQATPFGEYDAAVIAAIQNRWYQLLDNQPLTHASGKVSLSFHLNYDGTVSDVTVLETTVSQLLTAMCQRAIIDPAPYGAWPSDMRRMIGANFRDVTFTFYYL